MKLNLSFHGPRRDKAAFLASLIAIATSLLCDVSTPAIAAQATAAVWPPANTLSVYPGCSTPPTTASGNTYYIDPVNGSASGNGSSAKPWKSLQAVVSSVNGASPLLSSVPYWHATTHGWAFQTNPSAPVHPGDTILLMNGNYGDVVIDVYSQTISNSAFVTVAAAPGQTPVFSSLKVGSTNKWMFQGLTVNGLADGYKSLVTVAGQSVSNPSQDIILDSINVASAPNVATWTLSDWLKEARSFGIVIGSQNIQTTRCTTIRNSTIQNVRFGATLAGSKILFTKNTLNNLGDDFIDYAGSNLTITYNLLTNSNTIGDGNHNDFIQGQLGYLAPGVKSNAFSNILIDSNKAIRQTSPTSVAYPGGIQGIDAFDSDWNSLTVSNNSVITSTCQGIAFFSLHGGLIVNNTLVDDDSGYGTTNAEGTMCRPSIDVGGPSHEGSASNNVTVRNNLAPSFVILNTQAAMAMDHNVCTPLNGACNIDFSTDGKMGYYEAPGVYGDGKLISANMIQSGQTQDYVTYSPSTLQFDLDLAAGSPLLTAGSAALAPALNINGIPRSAPPSIGAY